MYQYQFLCGDAILVIPVTSQEKTKKFYLPEGNWYNLYSDELMKGNQELATECAVYQIPLYIKESSVIPMQSLVQTTKQRPSDTLFVHIYNGNEANSFVLYEDDGSTLDYLNGKYSKRSIVYEPSNKQILFSKPQGTYLSTFKNIQCILHGFNSQIIKATVNGQPVTFKNESIRLLDGLRYLENIYDPTYFRNLRKAEKIALQQTITFTNTAEDIKISW